MPTLYSWDLYVNYDDSFGISIVILPHGESLEDHGLGPMEYDGGYYSHEETFVAPHQNNWPEPKES